MLDADLVNSQLMQAEVLIFERYRPLIRENSVFYDVSGVDLSVGFLSGLKFKSSGAKSAFFGGIACSTPSEIGRIVSNGHDFPLYPKAHRKADEWREWRTSIPLPRKR